MMSVDHESNCCYLHNHCVHSLQLSRNLSDVVVVLRLDQVSLTPQIVAAGHSSNTGAQLPRLVLGRGDGVPQHVLLSCWRGLMKNL